MGANVRYVVGLTGGIGSGKSEVAALFAEVGADVLDADAVAHAISARGQSGHAALIEAFGTECLQADGAIDRSWLRERAFADPVFRDRLERTLHPLIIATIRATIETWRSVYGILVVPLLLERGGLLSSVQRVLVVDCPEEQQIRRVVARSGLLSSAVRAIMATQLSRSDRLALADDVIDNSGTTAALNPQIERLNRRYRDLAAAAQT
ncbi:MAG TPA: dephospho-CoA kinase [Casimicrobiaceae bacterium]|jgi:dephospho-CoA kinase